MTELSEMKCVPCKVDVPALSAEEIAQLKPQVPEWEIIEQDGVNRLQRVFKLPDFAAALEFTNKVGQIAEAEDHHPTILTEWGRVTVTWWTHSIQGLHQNDFIMAAKTDRL